MSPAPGPTARGPLAIIERYALYDEIASGGMASVHYGRLLGPVGFSRVVAIKRLHPQFAKSPKFVGMFIDEARLAAHIKHPNVVPTLDVVVHDGELFVVMEYVAGESLARLAEAAGGEVPRPVALAVMAGALAGLHAAHETKDDGGNSLELVHRDVSPQNILVGVDGIARVLDFGIAKALGRSQATVDGEIKGKVAYMPPEQLTGARVDRRADIHAAAVVLWELLTGRRLFDDGSIGSTVTNILSKHAPPPSAHRSDIPPELDAAILRGLAKGADDRFPTAREMALALERCGPIASQRELGEWVERVASGALASRRSKVETIGAAVLDEEVTDVGGGAAPVSEAPPPAPAVPVRPPQRAWPLFVVAAGALAIGLALFYVASPPVAQPDAAPTVAEAEASQPAPSATPAPTAEGSAVPATTEPPPQASTTPPPRPRPPPSRAASTSSRCRPPYTVAADGVRVYKPECF